MLTAGSLSYLRGMTPSRYRVVIEGEPFMLRSAIFACLDGDPRFDVVLAGAHGDSPGDVTAHADLSSVPQPTPVLLTVAANGPICLQLRLDGATRPVPYQGMRRLADTLMREFDNCDTWTTEIAVTNHA